MIMIFRSLVVYNIIIKEVLASTQALTGQTRYSKSGFDHYTQFRKTVAELIGKLMYIRRLLQCDLHKA